MKSTILGVVVLVIVGGIATYAGNSVEYTKSETATSTVETVNVVEDVDVLEQAKKELERINNELDAEESRLLEEKEAIEQRLNEIHETRLSFQ